MRFDDKCITVIGVFDCKTSPMRQGVFLLRADCIVPIGIIQVFIDNGIGISVGAQLVTYPSVSVSIAFAFGIQVKLFVCKYKAKRV